MPAQGKNAAKGAETSLPNSGTAGRAHKRGLTWDGSTVLEDNSDEESEEGGHVAKRLRGILENKAGDAPNPLQGPVNDPQTLSLRHLSGIYAASNALVRLDTWMGNMDGTNVGVGDGEGQGKDNMVSPFDGTFSRNSSGGGAVLPNLDDFPDNFVLSPMNSNDLITWELNRQKSLQEQQTTMDANLPNFNSGDPSFPDEQGAGATLGRMYSMHVLQQASGQPGIDGMPDLTSGAHRMDKSIGEFPPKELGGSDYPSPEYPMAMYPPTAPRADSAFGSKSKKKTEESSRRDTKLEMLWHTDPKKARRIQANRESAQRSKERQKVYLGELERRHSTLQREVQQFRALFPTVQQERNLYEHIIARSVTEKCISKQQVEEWTADFTQRCLAGNKDAAPASNPPPRTLDFSDADSARTDATVVDKTKKKQ